VLVNRRTYEANDYLDCRVFDQRDCRYRSVAKQKSRARVHAAATRRRRRRAKKDVAALDRLFNDDFIFVAANGSTSDKKKFLADVKANDEPSSGPQEKLTYEDFKVRVYGKTAIVNYVLLVSGKDKDGKDFASRYRMSVLWVKQKKDWRISNFHATRVRN
jgi:ketosteroid isomerase-like protein